MVTLSRTLISWRRGKPFRMRKYKKETGYCQRKTGSQGNGCPAEATEKKWKSSGTSVCLVRPEAPLHLFEQGGEAGCVMGGNGDGAV